MSDEIKEEQPGDRDEKGRFTPGHSGNAAGRPKVSLIRILREKLGGRIPDSEKTYAEYLVEKHLQDMVDGDKHVREDILDRIDGKAIQKQEISGIDGEPINIKVNWD